MLLVIVILLACVVATFVGIIMWILGAGSWEHHRKENPRLLAVGIMTTTVSLPLLVVTLILWPWSYFTSLNAVSQMQAFQNNRAAYERAIAQAENVIIKGAGTGLVDIAYRDQAQAYTNLVVDYRNEISRYNRNLQLSRNLNGTFLRIFRVDVPDNLQPIVVTMHPQEENAK